MRKLLSFMRKHPVIDEKTFIIYEKTFIIDEKTSSNSYFISSKSRIKKLLNNLKK